MFRRNLTSHAEKYVKTLFGIHRVEDAFQRLDKLTQEEARMAETETLMIAARIDENVVHLGANVAGMTGQLQSARADVQGVGHGVRLIHAGELFFSSLAPESVLSLTRSDVTGGREDIQVVLKYVSDINRSYSPNFITIDHESLTSRIGNESRKDLRRWIDAPDPSSNLYIASDAHHEGTAAWCTEGKTFADWMESGSLLWIHGKRKYTITVVLIVTDDSWIGSWLWKDNSQVCCPSRRVA
jgi:hypothetical protein